ncbi:hypothetical protein N474_18550 [Pseudoalteromonas luteoviolacea CPMOR-2]|uniref:Uncharacterized protein n=1 Tax=Pseudoalteromonas luteoviolacea DSM 6061 TaxID=1365250 RepID=A0A166VWB1_9GAMM|nr:hypothetical protein [Pseudoalteromonas luteoviolacea]KZN33945.1 hypothetical protein N475_19565 [Pseudoalteromonas luteoviolacea DSM 6061]KZN53999.1 hypothetical protein N474_18550 [Pseudoalteromonas luteoviolacea CPMOR-2]MBE0385825.1 hypothetical protein [Pseudoalteromonas luteoviolacea DSM 6061]
MAIKASTTAQDAYIELFDVSLPEMDHNLAHELLVSKLNGVALNLWSVPTEKHCIRDTLVFEVSKALMETKKYFRSLESNAPRDHEAEGKLVMLWGLAAIPIKYMDSDLAILLTERAESWLHPEGWTNEEIIEFGNKLQIVSRTFMRLSFPVSVWH